MSEKVYLFIFMFYLLIGFHVALKLISKIDFKDEDLASLDAKYWFDYNLAGKILYLFLIILFIPHVTFLFTLLYTLYAICFICKKCKKLSILFFYGKPTDIQLKKRGLVSIRNLGLNDISLYYSKNEGNLVYFYNSVRQFEPYIHKNYYTVFYDNINNKLFYNLNDTEKVFL